ncbi:MerR family transcriptional regulator [Mycolicibacterium sp. HK-90]|uniref:MerR family transcriptional regulator n=1 Tax=Mycolicibacterium sp. HK-90 TaxID=3056937 RepID=UPI00265B5DC3|nr:MerR family transcriptional regulator [Mycolicibacterium sp. HK-90]WKG01744.1 MerR family transcriptional regulator [Mycolicibacterium sp. HK-90]
MAEYRLEDLARISGVSTRNIRAYRERGLLDSPRRVGRAAYYGEQHVAQLAAISQLLAKGFSSAHIAEFFAGLRRGQDLADTLGIRGSDWRGPGTTLHVDPADDDIRTLVEFGLARVVDDSVELTDPALAAIVGGADDAGPYIRIMAHIARSTDAAVDQLAESTAAAVAECERLRPRTDLEELAEAVASVGVDRALRHRLAAGE